MKKLTNKMVQLFDLLETEVLDRDETFESRTEKWQESEKGEEYQELTDRLRDMGDELRDWIDELEQF